MPDDSFHPAGTRRTAVAVRHDIAVIGTSAGGMTALHELVSHLPADFPGSLFVVMHLSPESLGSVPDFLSRSGPLPATNAIDGEAIRAGHIYVAPPDRHLIIRDRRHVGVTHGPKENRFRPAIDPLFRSAALAFGPRVVGVVLTGYLDDGTSGLAAIKAAGGLAIVQDPLEAEAPNMPRSALRYVKVDYRLTLAEIGPKLVELASPAVDKERREPTMPRDLEIEAQIAVNGATAGRVTELGEPSIFTCPECHGSLIRLRDESPLRYRCHTGHAFTADSLDAALAEAVEDSLWSSVRALQEQAMLLNHMVDHATDDPEREEQLRRRSTEALRRADLVRQALLSPVPAPARKPREMPVGSD